MTMRILSTGTYLCVAAVLTAPLPAFAKNKAVSGEFYKDYDRCISEEVFLHVQSSGNSTNAKVSLTIDKRDMCKDEQILMIKTDMAKLKKGGLVVDDTLSSASVTGTLTVVDKLTKKKHELSLNLHWQGDGELITAQTSRDLSVPPSDEDELSKTQKYKIDYQDATAQGTIRLDSTLMKFSASRGASLVTTNLQ